MIRFLVVATTGLALTAAVWLLAPVSGVVHAAEETNGFPEVTPPPENLWLGVNSCAAMACHGGEGRSGAKGCEYTTWSNSDPHARAYSVLFEPLAAEITRNLGISAPPTKAAECLVCHVSGMTGNAHAAAGELNPFDGVGCESCHGPAKNWIGLHTSAAWVEDRVSAEEKAKFGLYNLSDPAVQVKVCMGCHVGSPDQDVNHQLLGAGHPRLFFEFSGFTDALPRHWAWKESLDSAPAKNGARDWALGQLATAIAALELTQSRAEQSVRQPKHWPQFAEYDCYSCHHDLSDPSWRQLQVYSKESGKRLPWEDASKRGTLPWGTWYYPMLIPLARQTVPEMEAELLAQLKKIDGLMQVAFDRAADNGQEVAIAARETQKLIADWQAKLESFSFDRDWTRKMIEILLQDKDGLATASWDSAAQLYIALDRLMQAYQPTRDSADQALGEMTQVLRFPKDYSSPKTFKPSEMAKQLETIRESIHAAP